MRVTDAERPASEVAIKKETEENAEFPREKNM